MKTKNRNLVSVYKFVGLKDISTEDEISKVFDLLITKLIKNKNENKRGSNN